MIRRRLNFSFQLHQVLTSALWRPPYQGDRTVYERNLNNVSRPLHDIAPPSPLTPFSPRRPHRRLRRRPSDSLSVDPLLIRLGHLHVCWAIGRPYNEQGSWLPNGSIPVGWRDCLCIGRNTAKIAVCGVRFWHRRWSLLRAVVPIGRRSPWNSKDG